MKKNITINLLGRLYAIDEDAYELLKRYTDSLRNYFGRREGGEEIANDIEARIAELFEELKAQGVQAITIEHVQDIIHRIGEPDEMETDASEQPTPDSTQKDEAKKTTAEESGKRTKRLYRNLSDRKFMGVLSGLAAYFGGDVLWWRLGFVFLLFFTPGGFVARMLSWNYWNWGISLNLSLFFLYIALGILMPVADTPEDRLRMKGKEVNPQNLADEVSQTQPANVPGDGPKGCINGIFLMIGNLFRGFIYIIGITLAITMLAGIIFILAVMLMPHSVIHENNQEFWQFFDGNYTLLAIFAVATLFTLTIPAYCIIHSLFHEFGQFQPMGFRQRVSMLVIWLVAFVVSAVVGTGLAGKVKEAEKHKGERIDTEWREENTHAGIFYEPYEWEFLTERGWLVQRADYCHDRYTNNGQYYGEDAWERYIDTYDERHRQIFTIERTDSLQPGRYQLTACVRADGQGAYIHAYIDGYAQAPWTIEIPAGGNEGGGIWQEAKARKDSIDAYVTPNPEENRPADYDHITSLAQANDGKGYGWNRVTIRDIRIKEPVRLHYGVTTDPDITHSTWLGHWFSACDFELTRIK